MAHRLRCSPRYEIKGTDDDWEAALAGRSGGAPGSVSVRTASDGVARKKRKEVGGKAKGGGDKRAKGGRK